MLEIAINNVEVGSEKHRVDIVTFCGIYFDVLGFSVHQNLEKLLCSLNPTRQIFKN